MHVLNKEEATQVSEAIFEAIYVSSDISKYHEIHEGVQWAKQIPFIGDLGLVGHELLGCKPDPHGGSIPFSEKTWTPKILGERFIHCADDLDALFKLVGRLRRTNPDYYDRIASQEMEVIVQVVQRAIKNAIPRIVWFADTAADEISGGGVYANGTEMKYFTMIDGLWKQIMAEIGSGDSNYIEISQNSGADYAAQENFSDDFAYELFKSMWRKADPALKQIVGQEGMVLDLHVTSAIYDNWIDYKGDKSLAFTLEGVENCNGTSAFRCINVIPRYDWDAIIQGYQDNGTTYNLPNRALLTSKENIPVGTVSQNSLSELDSFYDRFEKANVVDWATHLDAKFLQSKLAVAAY